MGRSVLWVVRGGREGEQDDRFLKDNQLVIGWGQLGDLSRLRDREGVKGAVMRLWPSLKPGQWAVNSGQPYRFAFEMKQGDAVIYPSKIDGRFHLGEVAGPYVFDPSKNIEFANTRTVRWIRSVRRDEVSLGARHEANSILTVFQVKNYADEFFALLDGQPSGPVAPEEDVTVEAVKQDIEETSRDYVLGKLARELKGYPFQDFIADLLEAMDYRVQRGAKGADGGIDLIAYQDPLCLEPPIIKIQVKAEEGTARDADVAALLGNLAPNERGLFITLGRFTRDTRRRETQHAHLRLIDGDELLRLIFEYYERSGTRLKSFLPLKRVYIPEQVS